MCRHKWEKALAEYRSVDHDHGGKTVYMDAFEVCRALELRRDWAKKHLGDRRFDQGVYQMMTDILDQTLSGIGPNGEKI